MNGPNLPAWLDIVNHRCGRCGGRDIDPADFRRHLICPRQVAGVPPIAAPAHPPVQAAAPQRNREPDDEPAGILTEGQRVILQGAAAEIADMVDGDHDPLVGMERAARALKGLPALLTHEAVEEAAVADPAPFLARLMFGCRELADLRGVRVIVDWDLRERWKNDSPLLGSASVLSPRERDTWRGGGQVPWFRVRLSLPFWLLADDEARERLVHAQLMSCRVDDSGRELRPVTHAPTEEHAQTAERYGLTLEQTSLFLAWLRHPATPSRLRAWGLANQVVDVRTQPEPAWDDHPALFDDREVL